MVRVSSEFVPRVKVHPDGRQLMSTQVAPLTHLPDATLWVLVGPDELRFAHFGEINDPEFVELTVSRPTRVPSDGPPPWFGSAVVSYPDGSDATGQFTWTRDADGWRGTARESGAVVVGRTPRWVSAGDVIGPFGEASFSLV